MPTTDTCEIAGATVSSLRTSAELLSASRAGSREARDDGCLRNTDVVAQQQEEMRERFKACDMLAEP